jgi:hypothetical protein
VSDKPKRCQGGCGRIEGEPLAKLSCPRKLWWRVKGKGGNVTLTRITLLDYGDKWFCEACLVAATDLIGKTTGRGLAVSDG